MAAFTRDSEAEAYLVFHEQGRDSLHEQFPDDAASLLLSWQLQGLIVDDEFGERAVKSVAAAERARLEVDAPARAERIRALHPGHSDHRPPPRSLD